ncbi:hypothetical protein [Chryseobacterium daeguense]|uniref:hypothetical protein n=1 Tax=Chryseobacterium daeguense TaxID=412438 RepID=UPI00041EBEF1|nr:hypothetical protein [Chryseobacterium daeguense]
MKKKLLPFVLLISTFSFAQSWNTTGNSGTVPTSNFIGTIDNKDLIFKTNNQERFKIYSGPYVNGIVIGNQSAIGTPGGARLELATVLCNGCMSNWAVPSDVVIRNLGSRNMEFFMPNNNAIDSNTDVSTPNSSGITKIKFSDAVHKSNLVIFNTGKVTVGTDQYDNDPNYIFYVKKGIKAEQVKVENPAANGWADYVFKKDYKLRTLEEVEKHIADKGHLPNIPSAKEVEKNGINLGEMDAKLLEKIEELTLYLIEQNKQINSQEKQLQYLQKENEILKSQSEKIERLEQQIQKLLSSKK